MKEGLETAPVCRMTIRKEDAVTAEGDGVIYCFCSEVCQDKLLEDLPCARISYDLPRPPWAARQYLLNLRKTVCPAS